MADGTTILLLGGGSDIGQAAVVAMARSAPLRSVVVAARSPQEAADRLRRRLAEATGASRETVEPAPEHWDATEVDLHAGTARRWAQEYGPFDVVICAVGALGHHAGASMPPDEVATMFATNATGPGAMLAALTPHLVSAGSGVVVVLSSVAAARPRRSNFVYGASKAALDAYAQGLGDAVADDGVRVVVVRPGFVRSKMTAGLDPAPFSTTPEVVGSAIATAVSDPRTHTVWVPAPLGLLMGALRPAPRRVWRRIAGDR